MAAHDDGSITAPARTLPRQLARVHSRSWAVTVAWGVSSDVGRVRTVNEDSTCVTAPVFAVADGMGGHHGGGVASALAVGALRAFVPGQALYAPALKEVLALANRLIFDRSDRAGQPMGTTVCGLAFTAGPSPTVSVFNVGDSRTYLRDAGDRRHLRQITIDHSHVQELYEAGEISFEDMSTHRDRHFVTRALGIDPIVDVDIVGHLVEVSQRWLVCSDGLTSELSPEEILSCLDTDDAQLAADNLLKMTLAGAARDNVSVVVVDVLGVDLHDDPDRTDPRPRSAAAPRRTASDGAAVGRAAD